MDTTRIDAADIRREGRGRRATLESLAALKRARALLELLPGLKLVQVAYLTCSPYESLRKWLSSGKIAPRKRSEPASEAAPVEEAGNEPEKQVPGRPDIAETDEWDTGPVPTVESIRRQIKRNMQACHLDASAVSSFATALMRLEQVKDQERQEQVAEEAVARTVIYTPEEDRAPGASVGGVVRRPPGKRGPGRPRKDSLPPGEAAGGRGRGRKAGGRGRGRKAGGRGRKAGAGAGGGGRGCAAGAEAVTAAEAGGEVEAGAVGRGAGAGAEAGGAGAGAGAEAEARALAEEARALAETGAIAECR